MPFTWLNMSRGKKWKKICADLYIKVEGRPIDDDGVVLMRFENGASGVLMASQTDTGLENNLKNQGVW